MTDTIIPFAGHWTNNMERRTTIMLGFAVFVVGSIADIVTTVIGIRIGYSEGIPLAAFLMEQGGPVVGMVALKLMALVVSFSLGIMFGVALDISGTLRTSGHQELQSRVQNSTPIQLIKDQLPVAGEALIVFGAISGLAAIINTVVILG